MFLFEFFTNYGDIVETGKTPLERYRDGDKDFSAEAVMMILVVANGLIFGVPALIIWFVARNLNFI